MLKHSKAAFRMLREMCGLTQPDLADLLGYDVKMVQRIENPRRDDWQPTEEAWHVLGELRAAQLEQQDAMADEVERIMREHPDATPHVELPYYRTQADYDACGRDAGSFRLVNRTSGEIAEALHELGAEVEMRYVPDESTPAIEAAMAHTRGDGAR